jgi:hypothetical protein
MYQRETHNRRYTFTKRCEGEVPVRSRSRSAPGKVRRAYQHNPNWEQSRELNLVKDIERGYVQQAQRVLRRMDDYIERNRLNYRRMTGDKRPAIIAIIPGDFRSVIPQPRPDRAPVLRRAAPDKNLVRRLTTPKYGGGNAARSDAVRKNQTVLIRIVKRGGK